MKRYFDPANIQVLTIVQSFDCGVFTQPETQDAMAVFMSQIGSGTGAGMIGMTMGNKGASNRPPGIDVEITDLAIQAAVIYPH
jgi:hypothetical protein